ncbi:hypothetical protein [Arthrobacter sp. B1I2]|uniref:hypothetical protein n=1 Tax=Arthrobacter sp. B1I2 TaxID=3042263 RepID=UPI002780A0B2|nr:hypothetical protein [Arthrobacter sp. B1I2]MDQ0732207.1 hypothetical protein [Arthrobacter sp. B1I2]
MSIREWWPRLEPSTQQWLIDNNGDVIPPQIFARIVGAGGPAAGDPWWREDGESEGPLLPDEAVGWVEETANNEDQT